MIRGEAQNLIVVTFMRLYCCFICIFSVVYLNLVVIASAIDFLERLVSKMICYVLSGTLNSTYSLITQLLASF